MSEAMKAALEQCLEHLYAPLPNCSCHILPPCNDCVEYAGIRDAIRDAKDALSQQPAQPDGALIDEDTMPARQISGYESREDMIQRIVNEASAKDEDHPTVKESLTVQVQPSCEPVAWKVGKMIIENLRIAQQESMGVYPMIALYAAQPDCEALRAKIDSLMLEFCPERMTEDQIDNWASHQKKEPL